GNELLKFERVSFCIVHSRKKQVRSTKLSTSWISFSSPNYFLPHSSKVYCPGCEPPNYCWRGICIHQARHLVDEEIFVPAASKGVSAFDGESCAKCHYPNQCIDRRCVPRGVERHLVNKCSYGADCGRGPWICLDGKCIRLQPEEEKNFY
uniref:Uncharacterized protein n=1 Tax=Caenorhabditis japonica TaxID=281687 RepID=A0A8R1IEV8_CAEJA